MWVTLNSLHLLTRWQGTAPSDDIVNMSKQTEMSRAPGHSTASLLSPWGTTYCDDSICLHGNIHRTRVLRFEMVTSVLLYRSPNVTTALKKKGPSGVTTIELKNMTTTYGNTGALVSWNMPRYLSSLSDVGVIFFELNRSINSQWTIFGLCHYCIQWEIFAFYN
jgi:hypothetical protein